MLGSRTENAGAGVPPPPTGSPTSLPVPGRTLGRYVVLSKLGQGGMGVVYEALDPVLRRTVAVKVLRSSRRADQLLEEARAMASLTHANVIAVTDVGREDDRVWFAMERVDGVTLRRYFEQEPSWRRRLDALLAAGEGLAAIHRAGLVHRDFKLDNVMIEVDAAGRPGRVRVMDLGLVCSHAARSSTGSGSDSGSGSSRRAAGTPAYMAPEQFFGSEVSPQSDQFALCVALFEALYGRRPFSGRTAAELCFAVTSGVLRTPRGVRGIPKRLFAIVRRGLGTQPAARRPGVESLLQALRSRLQPRRVAPWIVGAAWALMFVGLGASLLIPDAPRSRASEVEQDTSAHKTLAAADEAELSAAKAHIDGARVDQARAAIARLSARAGADDLLRLHTRLLLHELEAVTGAPRDAADGFEQVATDALERGYDRLAAIALATAGQITAQQLRDLDRARRLAAHARTALPNDADGALERVLILEVMIAMYSGRLDDAEALHLELLAVSERHFGARSPEHARHLSAHGSLAHQRGAEAEAIAFFERAIAIFDATSGRRQLSAVPALYDLAMVKAELGHLDDAEALAREVLAYERELGAQTASVANNEYLLGLVLSRRGKLVEARQRLDRAIATGTKVLALDHPLMVAAHDARATVSLAEGRREEALRDLSRALEASHAVSGVEHPRSVALRVKIATVRAEDGGPLAPMQQSLELLRSVDAGSKLHVRSLLAAASVLRARDRFDDAARFAEEAVALADLGKLSEPLRARARYELARSEWIVGSAGRARRLAMYACGMLGDAGGALQREIDGWIANHHRPAPVL